MERGPFYKLYVLLQPHGFLLLKLCSWGPLTSGRLLCKTQQN